MLILYLVELIPKPAVHYEDPPLYLCLRLGRLEKPQATTCPIEAYTKKKPKPEYWFSIPKEKYVLINVLIIIVFVYLLAFF